MNSMRHRIDTVTIPPRMQSLERDHRGYPIPENVQRDLDGRPHFTINDSEKALQLSLDKKCGICGQKLAKLAWFLGGPLSAFDDRGRYFDGPLHQQCAHYAVKVCPWLAAPNYARRIDDKTVDYSRMPNQFVATDISQTVHRPVVFVMAATKGYELERSGANVHHKPKRAWKAWRAFAGGEHLTYARTAELLTEAYDAETVAELAHFKQFNCR